MTTKTIINKRKHDLVTEHKVRLRPGENVMGLEKAAQLARSSVGQTWFKLGWIGVKPADAEALMSDELAGGAEAGVEAADTADTSPPAPMSAKDAIDFVADESDAMVLEGMLEDEDRVTVQAAITRRLSELGVLRGDEAGPSGAGDEG